jgi:hypothetical protein
MAERDAASIDAEWRAVEALVDAGEPFEYVEAAIDQSPLDREQQAALWLGGWARSERIGSAMAETPLPPRRSRRLKLVSGPTAPHGRERR